MNIYEEMNIIISYIEKNILEEIEINDLSKITGLNKNIIKNIFPLLVGYGLKEYIRNRKLTLCVEDIKNNNKIVDVDFKYGYNSSNSFITHKEEIMKVADKIIVMDNGKKVGEGTYKNLINKNKYYKKLSNI